MAMYLFYKDIFRQLNFKYGPRQTQPHQTKPRSVDQYPHWHPHPWSSRTCTTPVTVTGTAPDPAYFVKSNGTGGNEEEYQTREDESRY